MDQEIIKKLDTKIPRDCISMRDAGQGRKLAYLEGWYTIARMNEIFGQGNWSYVVHEMRLVFAGKVGDKECAHYVAHVQVTALGTSFSDYGYGDGTDKYNPGKAHELAVKEAVTDGVKRCAKNFGMSMGLALYDKTQENVDDGEGQSKAGAADSKRVGTDKPKGVQDANVPPSPAAPVKVNPERVDSQTVPAKEPTRSEVNNLIISNAKVAIAKKRTDVAALQKHVFDGYAIPMQDKLKPMVEALQDAHAKVFLEHLQKMVQE